MILKFHAQTPFIKGFIRTIIYDLQRCEYEIVPNEIFEKLKSFENAEKEFIFKNCDNEEIRWINFFIEKEFVFFIPELFKDNFVNIDFIWKSPSLLTNAIIDVNGLKLKYDLKLFEDLNCKHMAFRFLVPVDINFLSNFLLQNLNNLTFDSINLYFYENLITINEFHKLRKELRRVIKNINVIEFINHTPKARFIPKFVLDINTFSEALNHNLYFNRKIRISTNGDVLFGIEYNEVLFNLFNHSKEECLELLSKPSTFDLWKINKDKIDVCNVCEFRYMCIDNRIPIKRKNNTYFFKKECSYNPFIAKWDNELDYKSLEEIGVICNEKNFILNKAEITKLNEILWDD